MGEHDGHRERLRQRFLENGLDSLQDHEVLELLLFYAVPRRDTKELAWRLLHHFGSLSAVLDATPDELMQVSGIREPAAVLLNLMTPLARRYQISRTDKRQILNTSALCGEYLSGSFFGSTDELVYLLCLDAKGQVLACRMLQHGSATSAALSLRKAAEIAMSAKASAVVLAHNHPGGLALPSQADYETTRQLQAALEPLGIRLVDHIIVADRDFVSMKDSGFFPDP